LARFGKCRRIDGARRAAADLPDVAQLLQRVEAVADAGVDAGEDKETDWRQPPICPSLHRQLL
jgi:hypothetical protein